MSTEKEPIAIVGMSCLFPDCENLQEYWTAIKHGSDFVKDIPCTHWDPADYYDEDPKKRDHTFAKTGAFLKPYPFNPIEYGITPSALEATDTTQLLGMVVAKQALENAGYTSDKEFDRNRVSCILGVTGTLELVIPLGARLGHPKWKKALQKAGLPQDQIDDILDDVSDSFVDWQEASFPGLLGNVVAGRIANRLDLGGSNSVVDAACASSLAAVRTAIMELQTGRSDVVVTGGMDTFNDIFMYMCFSKTPALSPTGNAKPFDADGDGTILGEGLGAVILKRLSDAEADGDRIFGVIRGVGASSDGKGKAIYAPDSDGQKKALTAAYKEAGVEPRTIDLLECHGTGTKVGDGIELTALREVFTASNSDERWCTLGSVKSQIGHAKAAAGVAGLIKAVMALYHKVLPPTIKVKTPHPKLVNSPFIIRNKPAPWLHSKEHPRRAGVSAFGFGGSNYHMVLEEYDSRKLEYDWDTGSHLLVASSSSKKDLISKLGSYFKQLESSADPKYLAEWREQLVSTDRHRLMILSSSMESLCQSLEKAIKDLANDQPLSSDESQILYTESESTPRLAVVFAGQGSQHPNMLSQFACQSPIAQEKLTLTNDLMDGTLFPVLYPGQAFTKDERKAQEAHLAATAFAQPAIGALSAGIWETLSGFGIKAQMFGGHSYGELTALYAAGAFSDQDFLKVSACRGELMAGAASDLGGMIVVEAEYNDVAKLLSEINSSLVIANHNSPDQVVVSGDDDDLDAFKVAAEAKGFTPRVLRVGAAFHSPKMRGLVGPFADYLDHTDIGTLSAPVFANCNGQPYENSKKDIVRVLSEQLAQEVRFVDQIKNMKDAGADLFLEIGPSSILSRLVGKILPEQRDKILSFDAQKNSTRQLESILGKLFVAGVDIDWQNFAKSWQPEYRKPAKFSVPITGANYWDTSKRPERKRRYVPKPEIAQPVHQNSETSDAPTLAKRQGAQVNPIQQTAKKDENAKLPSSLGQQSQTISSNISRREKRIVKQDKDQNHSPIPADSFGRHLLAMQKMQQQSADLHRQFLENQANSQQMFFELLREFSQLEETSVQAPQDTLRRGGTEAFVENTLPSEPTSFSLPTGGEPHALTIDQSSSEQRSGGFESRAASETASSAQTRAPAKPQSPTPRASVASTGDKGRMETDRKTAPSQPSAATEVLKIVSDATGYPIESLNLDMDLEEDLGIDSIKRVEIFSLLQESFPILQSMAPEELSELATLADIIVAADGHEKAELSQSVSVTASAVTEETTTSLNTESSADREQKILAVISDKTGYPMESLIGDMSLEDDLGIDSIKRVEIISDLQEAFPILAGLSAEELSEASTISDLVELTGGSDKDSATVSPVPTAKQDLSSSITPLTPSPSESQAMDANEAMQKVQTVIAEKTGYPVDSLSPEMNLEEDLGIDSIKRVEILSDLGESFPKIAAATQDELVELESIEDIVGFVTGETSSNVAEDVPQVAQPISKETIEAPIAEEAPSLEEELPPQDIVRSYGISMVTKDLEPEAKPLGLSKGAKIWICDDGSNLARNLVMKLRDQGYMPRLVSIAFVDRLQAPDDLDGLIILGPLKLEGNPHKFLLNCFKLVKLCAQALDGSEAKLLATVSRNEGELGILGLDSLSQVYSGALAGLSKCVRHEWEGVRATHIDLSRDFANGSAVAERLIDTLFRFDLPEIGLFESYYKVPELLIKDISEETPAVFETNDLVLITGGGRGVTAAIAKELSSQPIKICLWGRTSIEEKLPEFIKVDMDDSALKAAIHSSGLAATPKEINDLFHKFKRQLELENTLETLRSGQATVIYQSVDVSSEQSIRKGLSQLVEAEGPIVGLIHGAGVLADKFINQLSEKEFSFVADTKIRILTELEKQCGQSLKQLVFFSSSTARFGRKGQVAYAVANEVLNKYAQYFKRLHPTCRVSSLNWGPWDGGMVDSGLKNLFAAEGIGLIPLAEGAGLLGRQMSRAEQTELVVMATPAGAEESERVEAGRIDFQTWPILNSHVLRQKGVVPTVLLIETMLAEVKSQQSGTFVSFKNFKILKGIALNSDEIYSYRVEFQETESVATGDIKGFLTTMSAKGAQADKWFPVAKANIYLSNDAAWKPHDAAPSIEIEGSWSMPELDDLYEIYLFHGEELQGISGIRSFGPEGIVGTSLPSPEPRKWIKGFEHDAWFTDPMVIDVAFQLAVVWSERRFGSKSLPTSIESFQQFRPFPKQGCEIRVQFTERIGQSFKASIEFVLENKLIASISGYGAITDDSLRESFAMNKAIPLSAERD